MKETIFSQSESDIGQLNSLFKSIAVVKNMCKILWVKTSIYQTQFCLEPILVK